MTGEHTNEAAERYRAFSENESIQRVVHAKLQNHGEPVDEAGVLEFIRETEKAHAEYIRSVYSR